MGFWQRLKLILSSNINALISSAEDPEKILEQLIVEMRKQFVEAKKHVAIAIADEKRLARQLKDEKKKSVEWEKKAMLAVRAGNDELARKALVRKQEHDQLTEEFVEEHAKQAQAATALRQALQQLNDKIEEARRKKNLLIARSKRAKAQKKIHETMSGLGDSSAFDAFDRMSRKVEQSEAEAEASVELASEMSGDRLDQEFKQLEAGQGGDDLLAALKARMAGDSGAPAAAEGDQSVEAEADDDLAQLKALMAGSESEAQIDIEVEQEVGSSS